MRNDIRNQIYRNLNQKQTEELIKIWQSQDHNAWTETAFELVEEILQDRIGDLSNLTKDYISNQTIEKAVNEDDDDRPLFYEPEKAENIALWLDLSAILIVAIIIVSGILNLISTKPTFVNAQWYIFAGIQILGLILQCLYYYFPLKALSKILNILMELELQSRTKTVLLR
jgi:hypothetical protein